MTAAAAMPAMLGLMAAGTTMSIMGQLQQGKQTQNIANARAKIDMANAEAARKAATEKASIQEEEGRKLLAKQKSEFIANGVLSNVGSPLVVAAQTKEDLSKDIGFTLEAGETEADYDTSMAGIEKAQGRQARQNSVWGAVSTGISGFGSLAMMGYASGAFGGAAGDYNANAMNNARNLNQGISPLTRYT